MTNTINALPLNGDLNISGATIITPGSKENSILWQRMSRTDQHRMPPIASSEIHHQAVTQIGNWIDAMPLPIERGDAARSIHP
jgi:hypothetical protein